MLHPMQITTSNVPTAQLRGVTSPACSRRLVVQHRPCSHATGLHKQHQHTVTGAAKAPSSPSASQSAVNAVSWHADDAPDIAEHVRLQRQQMQLQGSTPPAKTKGQQQQRQQQHQEQRQPTKYLPKTRGRLGAAASGPGYFGARAAPGSSTGHHSKHSWALLDGAAASIAGSGQPWLLQLKARVGKLQQEVVHHRQRRETADQQGPSNTQQQRKIMKRTAQAKQQPQHAQQGHQSQQPPSTADTAHNSQPLSASVDAAFERCWWASALCAAHHWKEAAVLADAWPPPAGFMQLELLLQRLTAPSPHMHKIDNKTGVDGTVAAPQQLAAGGSVDEDVRQLAAPAITNTPHVQLMAVPANTTTTITQQLDSRTEERVHGLRAADWRSFRDWLGQQLTQQLESAGTPARQALEQQPSRAVALLTAVAHLGGAGMDAELLGQLVTDVPLQAIGVQGLAVLGCSASDLGLLMRASWLRQYAEAAAEHVEHGDGASAVGVLWALARYKQVPTDAQATARLNALAQLAVTSSMSLQPSDLRRLMVATAQLQLPLPAEWQEALLAASRSCLEAASLDDVVQLLQGIAAQGWRPDADWWAVLFDATDQRRVALHAAHAGRATGGDGEAAAVSLAKQSRRQQHNERRQQEQERRQRLQEGELGDAHPADAPQQQQPLRAAPVAAADSAAAGWDEGVPSSEVVMSLLGLLLQLEAKPTSGWTTRLLEAHCRGRHDASLLPQLLALLPQVLPDPKTWAPHNKNLLDKLLARSAEDCLQLCGPQQLVQLVEALAALKHRPSRPILAWLNSAILRLGRAFPLKPLLQVRTAYLQLEKEPSEPRVSELFYVAYQKMVDRAKARERAEARAAGRKLGEKPSKAELARTWRKRKLKPPGTLKRIV